MLRIITFIIVIAVIYRLLNKYILPIFRITSAANSQMRQMQDQLTEMNKKMNSTPPPSKSRKKDGDYIEYEEVK